MSHIFRRSEGGKHWLQKWCMRSTFIIFFRENMPYTPHYSYCVLTHTHHSAPPFWSVFFPNLAHFPNHNTKCYLPSQEIIWELHVVFWNQTDDLSDVFKMVTDAIEIRNAGIMSFTQISHTLSTCFSKQWKNYCYISTLVFWSKRDHFCTNVTFITQEYHRGKGKL